MEDGEEAVGTGGVGGRWREGRGDGEAIGSGDGALVSVFGERKIAGGGLAGDADAAIGVDGDRGGGLVAISAEQGGVLDGARRVVARDEGVHALAGQAGLEGSDGGGEDGGVGGAGGDQGTVLIEREGVDAVIAGAAEKGRIHE